MQNKYKTLTDDQQFLKVSNLYDDFITNHFKKLPEEIKIESVLSRSKREHLVKLTFRFQKNFIKFLYIW